MKRIIIFAIGLVATSLRAQEDGPSADDFLGRIEFSVPDTPAFAVLDVAPQNVASPSTPGKVVVALLSGDDDLGNDQNGQAIELRPISIFYAPTQTLDWSMKYGWLNSLSLSIADAEGENDSECRAVGIRMNIIDSKELTRSTNDSDKFKNCFEELPDPISERQTEIQKRFQDAVNRDAPPQELLTIQQELEKLRSSDERIEALTQNAKKCLTAFQATEAYLRPTQFQLGAAVHDSRVGVIDEDGGAIWATYARPLPKTKYWELMAHLRISRDMLRQTGDEKNPSALLDEDVVAIRARRRVEVTSDDAAILFEASYNETHDSISDRSDNFAQALIGFEYKIMDQVWLQVAVGDSFGRSEEEESVFFTGQLRWAISGARLLK